MAERQITETTLRLHAQTGQRRFTVQTGALKIDVSIASSVDIQDLPDGEPQWEPRPIPGLNQELAHPLALLVSELLAHPLTSSLSNE